MKTIAERYIAKHIIAAIAIVSLLLIGLHIFIFLVAEFKSIGRGDYGAFSAMIYVLMLQPYQLYLYFPIACMLGSLLGLGNLANHNELLILRACGYAKNNIMLVTCKVILLMVLCMSIGGESIFPTLTFMAKEWKAKRMASGQVISTQHGSWLRTTDSFIHIDQIHSPEYLQGISQFTFDSSQKLVLAREIEQAMETDKGWLLKNISETKFVYHNGEPEQVINKKISAQPWHIKVPKELLIGSNKNPSEMTLFSLYRYIQQQKAMMIHPGYFELNFWRRLSLPITTIVMVMLAIPSVFGSLRSTSLGQRFVVGVSIGFAFHLINEMIVPLSQIYQLSMFWSAILPTILFGVLGLIQLLRTR